MPKNLIEKESIGNQMSETEVEMSRCLNNCRQVN